MVLWPVFGFLNPVTEQFIVSGMCPLWIDFSTDHMLVYVSSAYLRPFSVMNVEVGTVGDYGAWRDQRRRFLVAGCCLGNDTCRAEGWIEHTEQYTKVNRQKRTSYFSKLRNFYTGTGVCVSATPLFVRTTLHWGENGTWRNINLKSSVFEWRRMSASLFGHLTFLPEGCLDSRAVLNVLGDRTQAV